MGTSVAQSAGGIPVPGDFVDLDTYPMLLWLRADVDWTAASWTNHGTDATYSPAALAKTGAGADPTLQADVIDGLPGVVTTATGYYTAGTGTYTESGDSPLTMAVVAFPAFDADRRVISFQSNSFHVLWARNAAGQVDFNNNIQGTGTVVNDLGNDTDPHLYENLCNDTTFKTNAWVDGVLQGVSSATGASAGIATVATDLEIGEGLGGPLVELITFRNHPPAAQVAALRAGYWHSRFPSLGLG